MTDLSQKLQKELVRVIAKERLKSRLIDRVVYSSDAGFYRLTPLIIVQPVSEEEIKEIFKTSLKFNVPVTFRTGGTSLSGQSVTDGILIDLSQFWRKISPENEAKLVRVQPGAIGSWVNIALKKAGRKIGPDPSSIASAMMGGILANNASGMCCGVKHNSYHTLRFIRFLLPSGNIYSTEIPEDYKRFLSEEKILAETLTRIRLNILGDNVLKEKIRSKYRIKNTVGYTLNSFLDYEHPLDIFAHLLIGSEGTLAFISEAVMETLPDLPYKATTLLIFNNIADACNAIVPLTNSGAEAVELMDRASLKAIEHLEGLPDGLQLLPQESAALLVEYHAATQTGLETILLKAQPLLEVIKTSSPIEFYYDAVHQSRLWKIRKGLFPAVGAVRMQGTTVILEDIAFPVQHLANAVKDLQNLFSEHQYDNAIIFGHAKDGNLHFVITQAFDRASDIARYEAFIADLVELVVKKYDGSLKAEHGTGRNMAPFVETEWGPEAYSIMKEVKKASDPANLLNPGVIITDDPGLHLKYLKTLPVVEEEVDKCIECGFCERLCPSRDLTLTPRKRIIARRFMLDPAQPAALKNLVKKQYQYDGIETCAVDGLCATDCPVDINTGTLVKRLRKESHSANAQKNAVMVFRNLDKVKSISKVLISTGNSINNILGINTLKSLTSSARLAHVPFPQWLNSLKTDSVPINYSYNEATKSVIFFRTCVQSIMGGNKKHIGFTETLNNLTKKTGFQLIILENKNQCCGQAFSSKGYSEAAAEAANQTIQQLWDASCQGKFSVLLDTTSCALTLQQSSSLLSEENREKLFKLRIMDVTEFAADYILPSLKILKRKKKVMLHPVCSLEKMKLNGKLKAVAKACAEEVIIPEQAGCCGMAGDRGFFYPELIYSATKSEANEVKKHECDGYYSTGRTCEIALSETTGKDYVSLIYLLDEVS